MSDVRYSNSDRDWNRDVQTNNLTNYDQEYDRVMNPDSTINTTYSNRDVHSNRDTYNNRDVSSSHDNYKTREESRNQYVYNNRRNIYSTRDVHNNRNVHSYHDVKSKLDMHDDLDMSSKGHYAIDSNCDMKSKLDRYDNRDMRSNGNYDIYSNRDVKSKLDRHDARDMDRGGIHDIDSNRDVNSKVDRYDDRNMNSEGYHDIDIDRHAKNKLDRHDDRDMNRGGYHDIDSNRDVNSKVDRYDDRNMNSECYVGSKLERHDDRDVNIGRYHDIDIDRHVKSKLDRHDDRDMNGKDYRDVQNNRDMNSNDYRDIHNNRDMNSKDYRDIYSNRYVKSKRDVHDDRDMKSNRYRDIDSNRDDKRVPDRYKPASNLSYGVSYSGGATPECTVNMSYGKKEPWNTHIHYRDADQYTHTDYTKEREEQRLAKNKVLRRIRIHSIVHLILSLLAIGSGIWVLVAARENITFPTFNFGPIVVGVLFLFGGFLGLQAAKRGLAEAKEDTLSNGVKRWVIRHFVVCVIAIAPTCIAAAFSLDSARICFDPDPVIYHDKYHKHGKGLNLSEACEPNKTGNAAAGLVSGLICLMVAVWAMLGVSILICYINRDPRGAAIQKRLDIQRRHGRRSATANIESKSTA